MQVQNILKNKGSQGVETVPPGMMIADAAAILAEKRIGTLVISADGRKAEGILSERDIVRELAGHGSGCLHDPVETYMTRKLVTCTRSDTAADVLARMTEGRFRHMPVVEEDELVGLITLGDVVKAQLKHLAMEKDALENMIMGF